MEKTTLKEKTSRKLAEWKEDIRQLKDRLGHTAEEAKATFEKEKKQVVAWVDEMKEKVSKVEHVTEEKARNLKGKLDDLRVQAALGRADTQSALQEQQKQLRDKMHRLKVAFVKLEKEGEDNVRDFYQKSGEVLGKMQTRFDMLRWQLSEGKENAIQFWKDKKHAVGLLLDKMSTQIEDTREDASEKWETFSRTMSAKWQEVKSSLAVEEQATYFSDLHFDHRQWNNEIDFWEDELRYFESRLGGIVSDATGDEELRKIEHFQNAFIVHRVEVDELQNEIQRHEIRMAQQAMNDPETTAYTVVEDHGLLREKMDTQRKMFRELKNEFYAFLSKNI